MNQENNPGTAMTPYRNQGQSGAMDVSRPMIAPASEQFSPWDYLAIVLKRKWIIIVTVVIATTLATISALREPKIYQATARITIDQEDTSIFGIQKLDTASQVFEEWTVNIDTQMNILQSAPLAQEVVQALQLQKHPEFGGGNKSKKAASSTPGAPQPVDEGDMAAASNAFRSRLSIANVPNTRIVAVTFRSSDRQLTAQAVNTLANKFIESSYKSRYEQTQKITEWLSHQLTDLQTKVEVSQQKLVDYQRLHDIVGADEKNNIITERLDSLNKELTDAENERMQKEALDHTLATTSPELIPTAAVATATTSIAGLRAQEAEIKNQLAEMSATYGPAYPKVVDLKNKLKQVETNIDIEIKKTSQRYHNDYLSALKRENMLRLQFEKQKVLANQLNENAIQYNILKRDLESNRNLYEDLLRKMKEASITAGLKSNNIRIVDPAEVPGAPISPNVPRSVMVAFLGSLTLGVGLAFLLESLDKTIRNAEQVQFAAGLPALGVLPMATFNKRSAPKGELAQRQSIGLVAYSRPKSQIAEAYRALGTSILLSSLDRPHKVVMVTSALPEEGKTTTAVNSAIVLAQQGGRVLLIDADLRRPSVHKTLGLEPRCGLSKLATDPDNVESCILASPHLPNLHFLPAGETPANPAELLGSQRMKDLLNRLREKYDHIVVDTPPVLSITDAVRMSPQADAVMIVIRSGITTKESLCRARDLLFQVNAPVIGVVVNAIDFSTPAYYNYYAYNNYGQKYYSDKN